jgi:hypothetical protein
MIGAFACGATATGSLKRMLNSTINATATWIATANSNA